MNNPKNTRTLSRYLLLPILLMAALLFPSLTSATPYATTLTNNGPGISISFRLNESGIVTVVWTNLAAANITNNFGNRTAGLITTNMSGGGGPVPGTFTVIVAKTNTPGYLSGVALQISTDAITNGTSTNVMKFPNPRGVAINTNPASGYFGRIYVANSAVGTPAPRAATGDGIYLINADFTDAVGQAITQTNAARTADISTFTNVTETDGSVNSPWRLEIGEDNNLYIADFSTNSGTIYVTDPDVLTGTNIIVGLGTTGTPFALSPSTNHGRIGSSVIAKGSTNAGNLVLYALDTDSTATTDGSGNHITAWNIGSGPYPVDLIVSNLDDRSLLVNAGITEDLAQGPDGKFYTLQNRSSGFEGGIFVIDPTVDTGANGFSPGANGLWDEVYDSRADSIANFGTGTTDLLLQARAVAISPNGKFMAVARDDGNTWIIALTNGIPNLSQRRLVTTGGTVLGRDVAFDAAGNLYVAASGNSALRVYSPGYNTIATTTSSGTFSITNILPNQAVSITGAAATGAQTNAVEGSVDGIVTFSRTGDTNVTLTVTYVLSGTANRGGDYVTNSVFGAGATNTLIFGAGMDTTNVTVSLVNDAVGEGVETIIFTLLSSTNYVSAYNVPTTVYITDDGVDLPGVSITARGLGSYELLTNRPAKFNASLGTPFGSDVNTTVSLAGGTAVSGVDFTNPSSFTVTIPAGSTNAIFTVTPIDNATIASDKLIIASLQVGALYTNVGVTLATNTLRSDDSVVTPVLFTDDFDADHTANWVVKFNTNNIFTDFFFDYNTVGIPSAPHSVGGTTRGMKLKAHLNTLNAFVGVSVCPTNQGFTGDYRLRFDMWYNFNGPMDGTGAGSTELLFAGVGANQFNTNGPFGPVSLSGSVPVYFAMDAEGQFGAGLTGSRDYGAYTNTLTLDPSTAISVWPAGITTTARDNGNAYYAEFGDLTAPAAQLPTFPNNTRTNLTGTVGMCWHDVTIDKTSTNVTWRIDGLLVCTVNTTTINATMGTNIFFAYDDPNTGSLPDVPDALFGLIDNVRVERLPSTNAYLSNLVLTPTGTLNPAFTTNTFGYVATNAYLNNPVTVTATSVDATATLQLSLNGGAFTPLTSAVASGPQTLILSPPVNTVAVKVTAQNTNYVQTYTVNVLLQPSLTTPLLTNNVSGSTLSLNWAADHTGYRLETQTNSLSTGLGSTWFTVPNSANTNNVTITVDPANPTVFYRLVYP